MEYTIKVNMSLSASDIGGQAVTRLTRGGERCTKGAKRAITRYAQLIQQAPASPPNVVRDLAMALDCSRAGVLGRMDYPGRDQLIVAVTESAVDKIVRDKLVKYIGTLSYAEYAKLIEAVENYNHVSG